MPRADACAAFNNWIGWIKTFAEIAANTDFTLPNAYQKRVIDRRMIKTKGVGCAAHAWL